MIRFAAALLLILAGCATAQPAGTDSRTSFASEVEVVRDGDRWSAEFRFDRASPAWLFHRSALARADNRPWRPRSWTVETPGVRLERHGWYDMLVAERGAVPARVRIRFTPFSGDLIADYEPALIFTDGSVAVFTEQFEAMPVASAAAAARLPIDLNAANLPESPTRIRLRDRNGHVLHAGRRVAAATVAGSGDGTYVLFGPGEQVESPAIATVLDPGLPEWIRREIAQTTPALLAHYAGELGASGQARPTLMVSWAGPTRGLRSMGGSVLRGLIVMTFEGEGIITETEEVRQYARWFIAHEAAHFWLGQAVRYERAQDAWITEGGADLLAVRAIEAADPGYSGRETLQSSVDDCAALGRNAIGSAAERNEHRAYYACGAVFGLVAEAASRRPFSRFIRGLIDANREGGILTRQEWLAALTRASGDPALARDIGDWLESGAPDPAARIAALFRRTGVPFTAGEDGVPRLR
ncbi:MAG: hypothetical protein KF780_04510 [Sphingomonas sp.]|nr:hypothetical protein [Sphingomonas sp.]